MSREELIPAPPYWAAMLADEEQGDAWEAEPETLAAYERAEKLLAGSGARRRKEA